MHTKSWIMLLLLLALFGCVSLPYKNEVCPDGTVINTGEMCPKYEVKELDLKPENFPFATLNDTSMKFVKSGGLINGTMQLDEDERGFISLAFTNSDYNKKKDYLGLYAIETDGGSNIPAYEIREGIFEYNLTAPTTPGHYIIFIGKRNQSVQTRLGEYNITVIGSVNESLAYKIAERQIFWNTKINKTTVDYWNLTSRNISSSDGYFEVIVEASYEVCGIDWEMNDCTRGHTVTGKYIISKKTGQIVG